MNSEDQVIKRKILDAIIKPWKRKLHVAVLLNAILIIVLSATWFAKYTGFLSEFIIDTIWILLYVPLVLAISYLVFQVAIVKGESRRKALAIIGVSTSIVVLFEAVYVFTWFPISISTILFLLIINIGLLLTYGAVDIFEIRKAQFWVIAFSLVLLFGFVVILTPSSESWPGVTVEILGAFIGVVAALILAEILKNYELRKRGVDLSYELENELKQIQDILNWEENDPVPLPVWTSSIMSGALMNLDSNLRPFLTITYKEIELYNHRRTIDQKKKALAAIKLALSVMDLRREGLAARYFQILRAEETTDE